MPARWSVVASLTLALTAPLSAQTEADLKRYFEGKRVTLKIDMPGTEQGWTSIPAPTAPSTLHAMRPG